VASTEQPITVRRYRGVVLIGPFMPLPVDAVAVLEAEIGQPLPAQYRSFLDVAHGGEFLYATRVPPDPSGEVMEFGFTPLGTDAGEENVLSSYRAGVRYGPDRMRRLLPIARDGGGSTLYLDLDPEHVGRVWAQVTALPDWAGGRSRGVFALADTFDDYLDQVFVDPDVAQDAWEQSDYRGGEEYRRALAACFDQSLPGWQERNWTVQPAE
jgi:hypothetical protein